LWVFGSSSRVNNSLKGGCSLLTGLNAYEYFSLAVVSRLETLHTKLSIDTLYGSIVRLAIAVAARTFNELFPMLRVINIASLPTPLFHSTKLTFIVFQILAQPTGTFGVNVTVGCYLLPLTS